MKWSDTYDIAIELAEKFPDEDPTYIRFTDLREKVINLEGFNDNPEHSGEKLLEAIQMAWLEEIS